MGRSAKSFSRSRPRYNREATVLIICEDTKGGKKYLEDAKRAFDVDADVEVAHVGHTDPRGIVNHALNRQDAYDMIYCVIDRDTHETFDEAVALANTSKKIELIVSYPSFEYWLILHFAYSRKAYTPVGKRSPGAQALSDLKKFPGMSKYDKTLTQNVFADLSEKLPTARDHSSRALAEALELGNMNPSSRIHELLDSFEVLSKSR